MLQNVGLQNSIAHFLVYGSEAQGAIDHVSVIFRLLAPTIERLLSPFIHYWLIVFLGCRSWL